MRSSALRVTVTRAAERVVDDERAPLVAAAAHHDTNNYTHESPLPLADRQRRRHSPPPPLAVAFTPDTAAACQPPAIAFCRHYLLLMLYLMPFSPLSLPPLRFFAFIAAADCLITLFFFTPRVMLCQFAYSADISFRCRAMLLLMRFVPLRYAMSGAARAYAAPPLRAALDR